MKIKKFFKLVFNILFLIFALSAVVGVVYMLIVYDTDVNKFFNTPLNLVAAIVSIIVFSVLIVVINLLNNKKTLSDKFSTTLENAISDTDTTTVTGRFNKLMAVDKKYESFTAPKYDDDVTLYKLCEDFRNYAAYNHDLYYDITTIRSFIAGLAVNKLIIMQGISGTGKTSLAWVFGEYIGHSSSIIPVQPSWKERTDLLGYFNEFTHTFNETEFLKVLYEASYTDDMCVTVLDEMNIARVEYYFAEFLSLLELKQTSNWLVDLVSSSWPTDPKKLENGRLKLPENMWYIGTANNDDSTMAISDKVYDRAMVIDLNQRTMAFEVPATSSIKLSYNHFNELVQEATKRYSLSQNAIDKILELDKYMNVHLGITFGNRIMRQLEQFVPVYISCGGTENEAIDIIMARKVLRKLDAKNPLFVQRQSADFISFINNLFGADEMKLCKDFLNKYEI